jgi:hypothetical protein
MRLIEISAEGLLVSGPFASFGHRRPSDALVCTNHVVAGISKSSKQLDERKIEKTEEIDCRQVLFLCLSSLTLLYSMRDGMCRSKSFSSAVVGYVSP